MSLTKQNMLVAAKENLEQADAHEAHTGMSIAGAINAIHWAGCLIGACQFPHDAEMVKEAYRLSDLGRDKLTRCVEAQIAKA